GHDLLMSSQQDTNKYDSKQSSVAAGGSFTFGSMTGSGYISASQDKIKSRFDSVAEQTGIFAGDGGFDITVGNHTQLDGAVIASTATADKNSLDTGTLGFTDIHNEADFKTQHTGISISGAGSFGDQFKGNMPGGMIAVAGNSGHAEGTTQAAVADGAITIRDKDNQKQEVANLSRDTEHANDSISPIFDKEKEQNRLKEIGMISDIGGQVADIARTQGELNALKAAQDTYGPVPADATEKERQDYLANLRNTPEYKKEQEKFGTGSNIQRGIQAATAALQGLAGGNLAGALAGASAPELAHLLKSTEDNPAVNAIAHAILGGAVAALQGNSAAAGAIGAGSGELAARVIANMLYPNVDKLSEEQKQTVSALASISAGMAGGIATGNTAGAATGAGAGKNAVNNNLLGGTEESQTKYVQEHGKDVLSCADAPSSASCQRGEAVNKAIAVALGAGATGGVIAAATPELIAAAQAAVSACGANPVLCANEVSIWVAEMAAGDALPAGLTVATVGKMSSSELSELKALMTVEKQTGQKVSTETLEQLTHSSGGKGNWNKELNNPKPNSVYPVDGDKIYKTDNLARPSQVEATLSPNVKDRNGYQQCKAGKCGFEGDEGGHLIASIFNGPGEKLNLVPMDGNLNKGAWKQMENTWAKALGEGKAVKVNIQPSYIGDSVRPDKFKVVYSIDGGRPIEKVFNNAPGGK
ncbi:DNA/RNA non-specific endonuclease, partial [Tenebrionicola larvae]